MVTGPELSPPSPGGATYGRPPEQPSPSVLHTTFTNNACAFDYSSSNASSPEPSPLRLPMKSLAARAQQLAASRPPPGLAPPGGPTAFEHASPGHLILRMPSSQAGEVEASQGSKQHRLSCSSLPHQEELAPEGSESPRIAARHSWHQGAPCWQPAAQGRRASAASDAGSFIEWSLSSMSVAFPAEPAGPLEAGSSAAPLPAGNASLSRLSYSAACVAGSSDGDGDSLGDDLLGFIFVSGGHLIARAAPRFLWSPSSSPEGAAGAAAASDFSADSSPGGGNAAAGAALLGSLQTAELAGTAPAAAPPPAASHYHSPGVTGEGREASGTWHLDQGSHHWEHSGRQHPIFALQAEDAALAAAVQPSPAPTEAASELPSAADVPNATSPAVAPSPPPAGATAASPAAQDHAEPAPPHSPPLPPLEPSSSPVLPRSSSHRRFHSMVPAWGPEGGGERMGSRAEGLPAHERTYSLSITGSHIDFHLWDSSAAPSLRSSPEHGRAVAAAAADASAEPLSPLPAVVALERVAPVAPPSAASSTPAELQHQVGLPAGTYQAAQQEFERVRIRHIQRHIQSSPTRRRLPLVLRLAGGCLHAGGGGGGLRWKLARQRMRLLCLGKMPFDADDLLHFGLYATVCAGLTGRSVAQEGWRAAGFSSANPAATDLCGCGVLGLLHLALLLERRPALAAQLQLAVAVAAAAVGPEAEGTEAQPPPQRRQSALDLSPVLLSVHASLWTLQALRQGLMARAARRLKSATAAAECFYLGAMEALLEQWRAAGGAPQRLQEVLHRTEQRALANVLPLVQRALHTAQA